MAWASREDFVVFTHDLDFGTILHLTAAKKPSVIQLRTEDVRPITMGLCVYTTILQTAEDLKLGALVTIDPRRRRVTLLPLRR
jgi:predicted nuclease of predicted toxin-antitoxin system